MDNANTIIKITADALEELVKLKEKEPNEKATSLRVGIQKGGCSGLSYIVQFDEKKEDDINFVIEQLDIIIDPTCVAQLYGMEIDYKNDLSNRGFIYNNPNATSTCGCGISFN